MLAHVSIRALETPKVIIRFVVRKCVLLKL
jgi:hypothetical protein